MLRRAPERLGHYIGSRHGVLGPRNDTDLAESSKFASRTVAGIELGVRMAAAGTYALLQNQLAWAADTVDIILAGGEPKELIVDLYRVCQRNHSKLEELITDKLVLPCIARIHGQLGRLPPGDVAILVRAES